MDAREQHRAEWERLLQEMEAGLAHISSGAEADTVKARMSCDLCRDALLKIRSSVPSFKSTEDEIYFFRYIKPRFYAPFIFHGELYYILARHFAIAPDIQEHYFRKHLLRLKDYLQWFAPFHQYYKSGLNYLDKIYFVRHPQYHDHSVFLDFLEIDYEISTGFDYLLGKMMAYEMLGQYLTRCIEDIKRPSGELQQDKRKLALSWTAPKVALAELIYALHASGVFNHSQVDIKTLADTFSVMFGLSVSNIYKVWEEIRLRHKSRTSFLDTLKANLLRRMDEDDEAAK